MKKVYDEGLKREVIIYNIDDVMSELESMRDEIDELKKLVEALNRNISTILYAIVNSDKDGIVIEY